MSHRPEPINQSTAKKGDSSVSRKICPYCPHRRTETPGRRRELAANTTNSSAIRAPKQLTTPESPSRERGPKGTSREPWMPAIITRGIRIPRPSGLTTIIAYHIRLALNGETTDYLVTNPPVPAPTSPTAALTQAASNRWEHPRKLL